MMIDTASLVPMVASNLGMSCVYTLAQCAEAAMYDEDWRKRDYDGHLTLGKKHRNGGSDPDWERLNSMICLRTPGKLLPYGD